MRPMALVAPCLFMLAEGPALGQVLLEEHFDDVAGLWLQGWEKENRSYPIGPETWIQGGPLGAAAFDGDSLSFIGNGYLAGGIDPDTWTNISDWLFTPALLLQDGDIISFRALSYACFSQPDRLEVRMNTNAGTNVGSGSLTVGDFTNVLLHVNESQLPLGMPSVIMGDDWALYTAVVSGLGGSTMCRVAVRYFVLNGGPGAPNSSFIGIDDLRIARGTIGIDEHAAEVGSVHPNPTTGEVEFAASVPEGPVQVFSVHGRLEATVQATGSKADLSDLPAGIYTLIVGSPVPGVRKVVRVRKE